MRYFCDNSKISLRNYVMMNYIIKKGHSLHSLRIKLVLHLSEKIYVLYLILNHLPHSVNNSFFFIGEGDSLDVPAYLSGPTPCLQARPQGV